MAVQQIVVTRESGERVTVDADKVERDRDGTLRLYEDGTEVATFYDAVYVVRESNLAE